MKFKKSFKKKIALVQTLYKKLRLESDIELLHKYRVNLRKIYAYSEVYGKKIDKKSSVKLTKILKKLLKPTSVIRDLDLLLLEIDRVECDKETKEKLHTIFSAKREKKFKALLRSDTYKESIKELNLMDKKGKIFIYDLQKADKYAIISAMGEKLYDAFYKIDETTSLHQFHKLRIEFKKFRYALEAYTKYFNQEDKNVVNLYDLEEIQELFGTLQDNHIRAQLIKSIKKELDRKQYHKLMDHFDQKIDDTKQQLFTLMKDRK